jgi:hypothetical protein
MTARARLAAGPLSLPEFNRYCETAHPRVIRSPVFERASSGLASLTRGVGGAGKTGSSRGGRRS